MTRYLLIVPLIFTSGCFAFLTKEDGEKMQTEINQLKQKNARTETDLKKATADAEDDLKKLRALVDEATKVVTRNSADLGLNVQKMQADLAALTGRVDDLQSQVAGLSKSFTDYRAASDTKIEQMVNATTAAKAPPLPEKPDELFAAAQKAFDGKDWQEARRLLDAFVNRNPADARAAKAQFLIGESYLSEQKYASAIRSYSKVIDNYPKSEIVPDAMFKNGTAFYSLKYCNDARVYFQELLRRYPRTSWKKDATNELKKLAKDVKNKAVCQQ